MIKELVKKDKACRLQQYVILENDEGKFEYVAWDFKDGKASWIRGVAVVLDSILGLGRITADGEEADVDSLFELKVELEQLPEWDKTKYYCVVVATGDAALPKFCGTGNAVKPGGAEFKAIGDTLAKYGLRLGSE